MRTPPVSLPEFPGKDTAEANVANIYIWKLMDAGDELSLFFSDPGPRPTRKWNFHIATTC